MNKNTRIPSAFCLALTVVVMLASACRRDPCKRLDCVYGTCVDGTCNCQQGYGGDRCEQALNAVYDGAYNADELCRAGDDDYVVQLSPKAGTPDSVVATGIWGKSTALTLGTKAGSGNLYCPRKRFGSIEISLDGVVDEIDDALITLDFKLYYVGHPSHFDVCTATLTRQ